MHPTVLPPRRKNNFHFCLYSYASQDHYSCKKIILFRHLVLLKARWRIFLHSISFIFCSCPLCQSNSNGQRFSIFSFSSLLVTVSYFCTITKFFLKSFYPFSFSKFFENIFYLFLRSCFLFFSTIFALYLLNIQFQLHCKRLQVFRAITCILLHTFLLLSIAFSKEMV